MRCVEPPSYTVAIRAGTGGTVSSASVVVDEGKTASIAATAASGYVFKNWTSSTTDITFADANSANTTITVNGAGTVTANFDYPPAMLIYWDGTKMAVGEWSATGTGGPVTQANMLFFKFGSVVGFFNNNDSWAMTRIVFEPSTTKATTYANIPRWNGSTYNDGYISSDAYHTLANVQTGRGDPCKLVGLTIAQIAAGTYDNGLWRLPTDAENNAHYGSGTQFVGTSGQSGRGLQRTGATNSFLPAAGLRGSDGAASVVFSYGFYWSSRPSNATLGYNLFFNTTVDPSNNVDAQYGCAVRCVPQ